jgi:hypothetical protein
MDIQRHTQCIARKPDYGTVMLGARRFLLEGHARLRVPFVRTFLWEVSILCKNPSKRPTT